MKLYSAIAPVKVSELPIIMVMENTRTSSVFASYKDGCKPTKGEIETAQREAEEKLHVILCIMLVTCIARVMDTGIRLVCLQ